MFTFANWRWCIVHCVRFIPALQVSFPGQRPLTTAQRLWPLHTPELHIVLTSTFITQRAQSMYPTCRPANIQMKSRSAPETLQFCWSGNFPQFTIHIQATSGWKFPLLTELFTWQYSTTIWDDVSNYTHSHYETFSGNCKYQVNLRMPPSRYQVYLRYCVQGGASSGKNW
jgi:hypothetical protein